MKTKRSKVESWRRQALKLHLVGCSFAQIAEMIGKSASTVRRGIDAELRDDTRDAADDIKRERAVKVAQLDAILRGNLTKAAKGEANSSFVCIAAIKEQVRIRGLAAAEKIDVNAKVTVAFDSVQVLMDRLAKYRDTGAEGGTPGSRPGDPSPSAVDDGDRAASRAPEPP